NPFDSDNRMGGTGGFACRLRSASHETAGETPRPPPQPKNNCLAISGREKGPQPKENTMKKRRFFKTGLVLPVAGLAPSTAATQPSSIYARLGVRTFINAVGTLTTLSGSLMPPEVRKAMDEAAHNFVPIHELQDKVGQRLAELTGAQAAFVTAG